jgi:hypothetical protein
MHHPLVVEALILRGCNNYFQHSWIYDDYVSPLFALGCGGALLVFLCRRFWIGVMDVFLGGVFRCQSLSNP